jgi:hypothetical protein
MFSCTSREVAFFSARTLPNNPSKSIEVSGSALLKTKLDERRLECGELLKSDEFCRRVVAPLGESEGCLRMEDGDSTDD